MARAKTTKRTANKEVKATKVIRYDKNGVPTTKDDRIAYFLAKQGLHGAVMTYGNAKLPQTTLIFNHTTATECPSIEFCPYVKHCYARRDERNYTNYRKRNERNREWFKTATIEDIKEVFRLYIREASRNHKVQTVRLNEAGDFADQTAVEKFNVISEWLKSEYDITTYAYTCRIDLDFTNKKFILNASRPEINNFDRQFKCTPKDEFKQLTKKDIKCYGDCKLCRICYQTKFKGIVHCEQH